MATIELALRKNGTSSGTDAEFDWSSPPGMRRPRFRALFSAALRRERDRATIDMASLSVARETGCR